MITEIKHCLEKKQYKGVLRCIKSIFPPSLTGSLVFYKNHHRKINYTAPELLDEKLLILREKQYHKNPLITQCSDKYAVREYIESKGCGSTLNDLIGVYSSVDEIDWDALPNQFAIKCTHGSGYNIIVSNKSKENKTDIFRQLNYWMAENYAVISSEQQYYNIPPRIIIEKYLQSEDGKLPVDYKFFSSRGKVICCLLVTGRENKIERIYVDKAFHNLNLVNEYTGKDYTALKPESFDEMVQISQKLSRDFPFVRVDLYDLDGKVIFGELTFTPHGCNHEYLSDDAQKWIGGQITL